MKITIAEIADLVDGTVEGNEKEYIHGPAKIEEAGSGELTFLANMKYEKYIYETQASAVLVDKSFTPKNQLDTTLIRVNNVYQAVGSLLKQFEQNITVAEGIDNTAFVSDSAKVANTASIGAMAYIAEDVEIGEHVVIHPHVYIGKNVKIDQHTVLLPGVRIMHDCEIGARCTIHSNAVIGSDGFGFAQDEQGEFSKLSQTGNVRIYDDVEIGAATTIDRATMGSTVIEKGVKIDNQVQIAHNVVIGKNTAIAAQAGIAGSTKIGPNCLLGGQVGIVGHIEIDEGTQIQAQSGVASSTKKTGRRLYGTPALDYNDYLRSYVAFSKLPSQLRKIQEMEDRIHDLEAKLKD
jgi:UDP-3-O-[3-hydroxymyristoyl] glucosamine N-acyltransferase